MRRALERSYALRRTLFLSRWKLSESQLEEHFTGKVLGQHALLGKLIELMKTGVSVKKGVEMVVKCAAMRRDRAQGWSVKSIGIDIPFCVGDVARTMRYFATGSHLRPSKGGETPRTPKTLEDTSEGGENPRTPSVQVNDGPSDAKGPGLDHDHADDETIDENDEDESIEQARAAVAVEAMHEHSTSSFVVEPVEPFTPLAQYAQHIPAAAPSPPLRYDPTLRISPILFSMSVGSSPVGDSPAVQVSSPAVLGRTPYSRIPRAVLAELPSPSLSACRTLFPSPLASRASLSSRIPHVARASTPTSPPGSAVIAARKGRLDEELLAAERAVRCAKEEMGSLNALRKQTGTLSSENAAKFRTRVPEFGGEEAKESGGGCEEVREGSSRARIV